MQDVQQRLNRSAFEQALKARGATQLQLAEKIGVNPKSFSRWVNEGFIYSKFILDLAEELDLSEVELSQILLVPQYEVFFRKMFLGDVPEEIQSRAIELAKTLFGLTYLNANSHFCPPNVSKIDNAEEVANQIRKYTGLDNFKSLSGIISSLAEQGVEVAVIPFSKMGLHSEKQLEKAFSVTDGKRCLIFLDAAAPEESLIFNLCHELCHLFRPEVEWAKVEETFCNAVASELVYPKTFFDQRTDLISRVVQTRSIEALINLVEAIKESLGGEIFGIILRLKSLGFLSQKDDIHKTLIGYGKKSFDSLKTADEKIFLKFNPKDRNSFIAFWSDNMVNGHPLLRFFLHVKNGATDESISPRRFCEIFNVDISIADEMIHKWRAELHSSLKQTANA